MISQRDKQWDAGRGRACLKLMYQSVYYDAMTDPGSGKYYMCGDARNEPCRLR